MKKEIMAFAATWTDLVIVTLSEVSQTPKDKYHISLIHGKIKGYKWTYLQNRNRAADVKTKTYGYQEVVRGGRG